MSALRRIRACALGASIAVLSTAAATACQLSITDVSSTKWTGRHGQGYEVYDKVGIIQPVTFQLKSRFGECPYFITVVATSAIGTGPGWLNGPGLSLRYHLYKDASRGQPLKPLAVATMNDVFTGVAPARATTTTFEFDMLLPPEQVVAPGRYRDRIEISVYEGLVGRPPRLRDRKFVEARVEVPAVAEVSFSDGGSFGPGHGSYALNFDQLRRGERRSVTMQARSNAGYKIELESQNGLLKHTSVLVDSTVEYTTTVDGGEVNLRPGAAVNVIRSTVPTTSAGRPHVLEFEIGEIGRATAGDYRDVINVTITSLR